MSVKKLSKTFVSEDLNEATKITCSYDSFTGEISEVSVISTDLKSVIDVSKLWEQEPFLSVVDNIYWHGIYLQTYPNDHE